MAGFKRAYTQFPGYDELANIESVNIIETPPPSFPLGASGGVVCVVGEYEKGPLEMPTRVFGDNDISTQFGGFGFTKSGRPYRYPVAARSAGSSFTWNGNAFIQTKSLKFAGLIICRVDNSAGDVSFSRLACVSGTEAGPWNLTPNGTLLVSVDGGSNLTATFTAAQATILATGASYPTNFVGGETLELALDGNPTQVVTFTSADQSLAQVITRINSVLASTVASDNSGQLQLDSRKYGWSASIEVVGGTARSALGLPTAPTQQVDTFTVTSNTGGGTFTFRTALVVDGTTVNYDATYEAAGGDSVTVIRDALLSAFQALGVPGVTYSSSGGGDLLATGDNNVTFTSTVEAEPDPADASATTTTPAVLTLASGTGVVADASSVSEAEYVSVVSGLAGVTADIDPDGFPRVCATTTPLTGTVQVTGGTEAATFGFDTSEVGSAGTGGIAGTIPAGTLLQDSTTLAYWLTLEDVEVTADGTTAYTAKVRPAVDDDTTPTAEVGDLNTVVDGLFTAFSVTNALALSRLTDSQMDARYVRAIDATIDSSGVAHDINQIVSARTSATINGKIKSNTRKATSAGHRARKAAVAPAIGTSRTDAKASTGNGVGAVGREQRVTYCFPGGSRFIPEIAEIGTDGGTGFTEDGIIDVPANFAYASVRSILNPEEDAGQQLSDTNLGELPLLGLESAYDSSKGGIGLTMKDYIDFKANGICALRSHRTSGLIFQSDVTSVNPATQPALVDNLRRYFSDFLMDTLFNIGMAYEKKLNRSARRRAFMTEVDSFLELLASPQQPDVSRLEDYRIKDETDATLRGLGFQIVRVAVRQYNSMKYIVFRLTSGTTVSVEEVTGE